MIIYKLLTHWSMCRHLRGGNPELRKTAALYFDAMYGVRRDNLLNKAVKNVRLK